MSRLLFVLLVLASICIGSEPSPKFTQSENNKRIESAKVVPAILCAVLYDLEKMVAQGNESKNAITFSDGIEAISRGRRNAPDIAGIIKMIRGDRNAPIRYIAPQRIAELTDPVGLAGQIDDSAAKARLPKIIYWLSAAEVGGERPSAILFTAAKINGTLSSAGGNIESYSRFVIAGLLENLRLAKEYGILTPEGMAELRSGKAATITKGEFAGQDAEPDYVIPLAVCPELENQVFNLELMPAKLCRTNERMIGKRQKFFAKALHDAKLLSDEGWAAVEDAGK